MSDWYTASGSPATRSQGSSATMRSEFDLIQTALDKLPALTGAEDQVVKVNAGGTALESVAQLAVAQGGTGAASLTDGGILLGSGTGPVTAMAVLADGAIVVGDGAGDPVPLAAFTSATGVLKHERGGLELNIAAIADGDFIVGTGAGTLGLESGATARASIGLGNVLPRSATDSGTDTYDSETGATTPPGTGKTIARDFQSPNTTTTPTLDGRTIKTRDGSALWAGAIDGTHTLYDDGTDYRLLDPILAQAEVYSRSEIDAYAPKAVTDGGTDAYTFDLGADLSVGDVFLADVDSANTTATPTLENTGGAPAGAQSIVTTQGAAFIDMLEARTHRFQWNGTSYVVLDPAGGMVEKGAAGFGEYRRYADGMQVINYIEFDDSANFPTGRSGDPFTKSYTFPAAFTKIPLVQPSRWGNVTSVGFDSATSEPHSLGITTTGFDWAIHESGSDFSADYLAIGEWK